MSHAFNRRTFFGGAGATALAAGALAGCSQAPTADAAVRFDGKHQAGITTEMPERLHFAAFNVVTDSREELARLLQTWTAMARRMTRGETAQEEDIASLGQHSVPRDTGEAYDLRPGNLTLTIGFGPSLFDDRFGLAPARPAELEVLPKFAGDQLKDEWCDGDIAIQACSDNPQVAVHAIRNLARAGDGVVEYKWSQLGFGHASATTKGQQTPRNLFGFKDGTNNLKAEDEDLVNEHVWVSDTGTWFDGGTYLIVRKIKMLLENWDRQVLADQEESFGRVKGSGAPLGREDEFDELPLDEYVGTSGPVIPTTAHARIASHQENDGARMLRRAYNYTDGIDQWGHLEAGLFFIALVNSPKQRFIPIQAKLAKSDKMNEYVRYESAAIFACPPGTAGEDDWWGKGLFAATA